MVHRRASVCTSGEVIMGTMIALAFSFRGLIMTLLIITAWLHRRLARGPARRVLTGVVAAYVLASLYCVPYGISRILVSGYQALTVSQVGSGRTAIVVFAASEWAVNDWDGGRLAIISPVGAARILETVRVYRLCADAWVISSGGAGTGPSAVTSGAAMQEALVHLGVPSSRILVEKTSQSTYDEAVLVAAMLRALNPDRVILVTSDVHMRRALGTFRAAGVTATPAIARDPYIALGWWNWALPTTQALALTSSLLHESVGIGYYAARGRWR